MTNNLKIYEFIFTLHEYSFMFLVIAPLYFAHFIILNVFIYNQLKSAFSDNFFYSFDYIIENYIKICVCTLYE